MHIAFTVTVVLFVSSFTLCSCLEEAHLVPKVGLEPKHVLKKRDLSAADTEMILKALIAKLEHSVGDGEAEKEMMTLLMKIKELGGSKIMEEEYKKDIYSGTQDKKLLFEKTDLVEDAAKKEMSKKMLDDSIYLDKFSDKDVSLAESLYHMKIAGDVETYPSIKMESLYEKKLGEDKLFLGEANKKATDEAFIKKVNEMDKSLIKEESYPVIKDDDIEGYLKKVAEEEKGLAYDTKVSYSEKTLGLEKTAEEKALEEWKASHKDIFPAEEKLVLDEKFKLDDVPHVEESIAHELNDELIKKLKSSLGMDKALGAEFDEHLTKDLHEEKTMEGSHAYEKAREQAHKDAHIHLNDEEIKKHVDESVKAKEAHDIELALEKGLFGENSYGFDSTVGIGMEKSLHDIAAEEALKSKDAHALDKSYGFDAKLGTGMEKTLHDIAADEALKAKDTYALDKAYEFEMDKAMHGTKTAVYGSKTEIGVEKTLHGIAEEKALKSKEAHALEETYGFEKDKTMHGAKAHSLDGEIGIGIDKTLQGITEEEARKSKAHGLAFDFDMDKKIHGAEATFKDEIKHAAGHDIRSTFAAEADKVFKIHEDELMKKDKAYGDDVLFHKDILKTTSDHHMLKDEEAHKFHETAIDKHHVTAKDEIIGAEKSHFSFHDLKAKFFELLRKVLHIRKCHLVTMSAGELLSIVNCVSRSKSFLQHNFNGID